MAKKPQTASFFSWIRNFGRAKSTPNLNRSYIVPQVQPIGRVTNQEGLFIQFDHLEHLIYCREAYFQNPYARIYVNRQVSMVVNDGLTLQFSPMWEYLDHNYSFAEQQAKQIEVQDRWFLWASSHGASITNNMNFHLLQHELYKTLLRDGEFFVLLHRHYDDQYVNPLRLQIIHTDAVPYQSLGEYEAEAHRRGNYIDFGIEHNAVGEAVAYYFMGKDRLIRRVPTYAKDGRRLVIHVKIGDYLNGTRGASSLISHLKTLAKIRDFEQNELSAMKMLSQIAVAVEPSDDADASEIFDPDSMPQQANAVPQFEGLVIQNLRRGEKLVPFGASSNRPNSNLIAFVDGQVEAMMVSAGMPVSVAKLHMNKSYSASRAELSLFEDFRKQKIEEITSSLHNIIFGEWLREEILYNDLVLVGYHEPKQRKYLMNLAWHADPIPDLDPLKSAKSLEHYIGMGVLTHEQATRLYNDGNWDDNVERLAREYQKMRDLGLMPAMPSATEEEEDEEKEEEEEDA